MSNPSISREELLLLIKTEAPAVRVVEALPAKYYEEWHLPSAVNLPLDQIEAHAADLLPDRAALVVTYCAGATCENSRLAAEQLRKLGYQDVREYREGKADWIEAGLPVDKGSK